MLCAGGYWYQTSAIAADASEVLEMDDQTYQEPMHGHTSIVWHGGMGHRLISEDGGSSCYRCGMFVALGCDETLIPDCMGPQVTGHTWEPTPQGIGCAYDAAEIRPDDTVQSITTAAACKRA